MAAKQMESASRFTQAAAAYPIIVERAGKNWGAFAPDLPGCVAAADTPEETETLMREAIAFHLEGMEEDGEPWPLPGSHTAAQHTTKWREQAAYGDPTALRVRLVARRAVDEQPLLCLAADENVHHAIIHGFLGRAMPATRERSGGLRMLEAMSEGAIERSVGMPLTIETRRAGREGPRLSHDETQLLLQINER